MQILTALAVLGILGLVFGALLGLASKIFAVQKDERIDKIVECLPGANCGGCGYAGCENFAKSVVEGEASTSGCPVSNDDQRKQIADIMGVSAEGGKKLKAVVKCKGTSGVAEEKYRYVGISDCVAASRLRGGYKQCRFACLGLGSCVSACTFDAITVKDNVAVVDESKCTGCGACAKACPKNVIELVEEDAKVLVMCSSQDKGTVVTKACRVGCIGCGLCAKNCPVDAIFMENNLAHINYDKCINCGECVSKCPRSTIYKGETTDANY